MKRWFVVAKGYHDEELVIVVFGPFKSDVDAKIYAMDVYEENGWQDVEAHLLTNREVRAISKDPVVYPYEEQSCR